MSTLHLTKVAVGCRSTGELARRQSARASHGSLTITTRYRPKRHEALVGGSIYWIVKRRLAVRQRIIGFEERDDGRWDIRLDAELVPLKPRRKRVHQGWRYLDAEDAPADLGNGAEGLATLPPKMLAELSRLALI